MSFPRRVLKQQIHMISRRCSERRFFLKPSKKTNLLIEYCLGAALERFSVEINGRMFEANHYHFVLSDPKGELSLFEQYFDTLVARALNAYYGRGEAFWCPGSFSNVEIWDHDTLVNKLVYVIANPVKDGLVERPEHWPGLSSLPEDMGTFEKTVKKPDFGFFGGKRAEDWVAEGALSAVKVLERKAAKAARDAEDPKRDRSTLPEEVTIKLCVPLGIEDRDAFVAEVRAALEAELEEIKITRGEKPVRGVAAIRALNPYSAPGDSWPGFKLNPRIACGDAELRARLLAGLQAWRDAYQFALFAWRSGKRRTRFPVGTFLMHRLHKCELDEEPAAA